MMFTVRLSYECEELMPDLDDPRKQAMIRVQYPCRFTIKDNNILSAIDEALRMVRYENPPYTLIHVSASKENQE